ncbi:protein BOLA2 [Lycium ferocissimum]|uniref:protein BOLA2 n=1 Tax=Lycium ferocissimum TaxID=112874 RepID=UPI002814D9D3|nr:protein BOLA2 [Lycium ferocissimum]
MGVTKEQVESSLTAKLNASHLEVIDMSGGCGAKFSVVVVSEQFEGKRLLERHRMVNGALAEEMKEIHALSITKAVTPEQWKQQQETEKSQTAA